MEEEMVQKGRNIEYVIDNIFYLLWINEIIINNILKYQYFENQ